MKISLVLLVIFAASIFGFQNCSPMELAGSSSPTKTIGTHLVSSTTRTRPTYLLINANTSPTPDGHQDVLISGTHLLFADEIAQTFCASGCPQNDVQLGIEISVSFFEESTDLIDSRLKALVASAKDHQFHFMIHANHEWIFQPGLNPFDGPSASWAEASTWDTPLQRYWVAWGTPVPEIGLKPNYLSSLYRNRVAADVAHLKNWIAQNISNDPTASNLFLGVDTGWETEVTPNAQENKTEQENLIGYAALKLLGFSASNPPPDFNRSLGNVANAHIQWLVDQYTNSTSAPGLTKSKLFTHIVVAPNQPATAVARRPLRAALNTGINFGASSFAGGFDPQLISSVKGDDWSVTETDPTSIEGIVNGFSSLNAPLSVSVYSWGVNVRTNETSFDTIRRVLAQRAAASTSDVTGTIDSVDIDAAGEGIIAGWACQPSSIPSVQIHIYAGPTIAAVDLADKPSEPAVADRCQTQNSYYRFKTVISKSDMLKFGGQKIYVYAISPIGRANFQLANSGSLYLPNVAQLTPVVIYQLWSPELSDHLYSVDPNEGVGVGYHLDGPAFSVLPATATGENLVPLYRCSLNRKHIISTQFDCEGWVKDGMYGYVYGNRVNGSPLLFRYSNPSTSDHFVTADPGLPDTYLGYNREGNLGYGVN